jgi:hypothetical protein
MIVLECRLPKSHNSVLPVEEANVMRKVLCVVALIFSLSIALAAPISVSTYTTSTPLLAASFAQDSGTTDKGNPNVKVWVNTNSGVYHCPGTRWYGKTKSGEYMTQKQAQEKGYRPAYGKVCR